MKESVRKQGGSEKRSEMSVFLSNKSDGREVSWLLPRVSQRTNRSEQKEKRRMWERPDKWVSLKNMSWGRDVREFEYKNK